jgi:hypothetical protein
MSVLIITLIILLIVIIALVAMYYFGFFGTTKNPSDFRPFTEFSEIIEPSILPMAKKDYNKLVLKFFEVLNKQSNKLDFKSISEMSDTSLMAQLNDKMKPYVEKLKTKYTPQVAGKLIKYFACKHVTILLDNYYTGPPINYVVPEDKNFGIDSFTFTYKSKTNKKVVNASTLAPYKYFSYNIPSKIRKEVSELYDSIMDRYMDILNNVVKSLREVNNETLKTIDVGFLMQNYRYAMEQDFNRIQQLFGANVAIIVKSIFTKNLLPLFDEFYKGPGIDLTSPPGPNREVINIKYPNTDKNKIFTVTTSPESSVASSQLAPTISVAPTISIAPTTPASPAIPITTITPPPTTSASPATPITTFAPPPTTTASPATASPATASPATASPATASPATASPITSAASSPFASSSVVTSPATASSPSPSSSSSSPSPASPSRP